MIRKPLIHLAAFIALVAFPIAAFADPFYVSEGIYGTPYGTTAPAPVPGVPQPFSLDSLGNLNVNIQGSSTSGSAQYPAAYAHTGTNGSITLGGTPQTWAAAGTIKHGCLLQNTSSAAEYVTADGTAATTASFYLQPLTGVFNCDDGVPTGAASILGANTAQTYRLEIW